MQNSRPARRAVTAFVAAWGLALAAPAAAEADFSGETIEIVFNTGPGGAVDQLPTATARVISAIRSGSAAPAELSVVSATTTGAATLGSP